MKIKNIKNIKNINLIYIILIILIIITILIIICFFNYEFIINSLYSINISKVNKGKTYININNEILNLSNNYYNKKDLSNIKLIILVNHYNENLFWLKNINFPFIISSKSTTDKNLYFSINKGNEATAYLYYIIKYYDKLPEYTIFCHGHLIDWHQFNHIDKIINDLGNNVNNSNIKIGYFNFNNIGIDSLLFLNSYKIKKVWNKLFQDELGDMPEYFYDRCCAQFIVHRDRIRLRSKKFYENILNYSIYDDYKVDDNHYSIGYILEYTWHYIFGEPAMNIYNNYYSKLLIYNYYNNHLPQ